MHDLTIECFEVVHGSWLAISRYNYLNPFGEDTREPEGHIGLGVEIVLLPEMIDSLKN